jgi:general secretion pathway protein E
MAAISMARTINGNSVEINERPPATNARYRRILRSMESPPVARPFWTRAALFAELQAATFPAAAKPPRRAELMAYAAAWSGLPLLTADHLLANPWPDARTADAWYAAGAWPARSGPRLVAATIDPWQSTAPRLTLAGELASGWALLDPDTWRAAWAACSPAPSDAESATANDTLPPAWRGALAAAVRRGATDIHIESVAGAPPRLAMRERRASGLLPATVPSAVPAGDTPLRALLHACGLEHQRTAGPQDGHLQLCVDAATVDFRVSAVPTSAGFSVVLRVLDPQRRPRAWQVLGWSSDQHARIAAWLAAARGWLLVSGATGAGKTTTLYALVEALAQSGRKILTIEDPVEYPLTGVVQCEEQRHAGWTADSALRHFLRHDPDVIVIGEIRDGVTARLAAQAALTGHAVLATIHAASAALVPQRLAGWHLAPWQIAATLQLVVHQRLVALPCPHCAAAAGGCINCRFSGNLGWQPQFTVVGPTPDLPGNQPTAK